MGNASDGKKLCTVIALYMAAKSVLNLVLGFGIGNFVWLIAYIALGAAIISAYKYSNFITGAVLALMFLINVKTNISGGYYLYLAEGIIDAVCAVVLFVNRDIKAHFNM